MALSCIIIGAGAAGIFAGRVLRDAGVDFLILDKGRSPGGRLAYRRVGEAVADSGAQFFTIRDSRFRDLIAPCLDSGRAVLWNTGLDSATERYAGLPSMSNFARTLAEGLPIRLEQTVRSIDHLDGKFIAACAGDNYFESAAVLLTAPAPQSLSLIEPLGGLLPARTINTLKQEIQYEKCLALLCETDGPPKFKGALRFSNHETLEWLGDNRHKGVSPDAESVTIHANARFSEECFMLPDKEVAERMIAAAQPYIGANVNRYDLMRWRYSKAVKTLEKPFLLVDSPGLIAFAGDGFAGSRVESAALSGLEAAGALIAALKNR